MDLWNFQGWPGEQLIDGVRKIFAITPAAPPAAPGTNAPAIKPAPLTHEQRLEINTKIDILDGIPNFHTDFAGVDHAWAETKSHWVDFVKTNRPGFISIIGQMREVLGGVSSKISGLQNEYREYPDIYALLDQPKTGGALKALKDLSDATAALPDPPSPDFDITLRPFVGTVTTEVEAMMAGLKDFENQSATLLKQLKVRAQQ